MRYLVGLGSAALNTSSRISAVEDVRAVWMGSDYRTYTFEYTHGNGDTHAHLTSITNHINSGERYNIYYWPTLSQTPTTVPSPFTGAADSRTVRFARLCADDGAQRPYLHGGEHAGR